MTARQRDDRGSGTGLTLAVVAVLALVASVVALVGWGALGAQRLRSAADLSALAGARALSEGGDACAAAEVTARLNEVSLRRCRVDGDAVTFVVSVTVRADLGSRGLVPSRTQEARALAGNLDVESGR
ncbi:Rv3654c family TadE-like protein [Auraticoccus monumenti]|uniref:Helicase/secretion neighborhood TadE-like protein n=1 Tax=Auraticoccus monumenti TaxID=675864 RepID=A0A1G6RZY2_9ACTN|nr:Rv3654c family TadE-like protein [Auraticoccus monumenti]SDD10128.1 helicase/secretion neighborhood TadE-like protein [Auraticoccus monumenti]